VNVSNGPRLGVLDGAGHGTPVHDWLGWAEAVAACAALGVDPPRRLGFPDGAVADHEDAGTESLKEALAPDEVWLATWRADGRPDHEATGRAPARACAHTGARLVEYPVWMWHWAAPLDPTVPWQRVRRHRLPPQSRCRTRCCAVPSDQAGPGRARCRPGPAAVRRRPPCDRPGDAAAVKSTYFENMYAANPDPWGFESRWYEQRKYALTLAALTRRHYRSVFEPGCSIGVLTAQLLTRCDRLLSCDLVQSAVDQAARRVSETPGEHAVADVRQWDAHGDWPDERFDLVLVSEMLYYLDPDDAARFMSSAAHHLDSDGEIVLVHWRQRVPEYPLTGDEAHEIACVTEGLEVTAHYEDEDLRLDVLGRAGQPSVADREGLRG